MAANRALFILSVYLSALLLSCNAAENSDATNLDRHYYPREKQCSGFCVTVSECPEGKLSKTESCPNSESKGAACCYGVPKSENRCQKLGGECTENSCPSRLTKTQATDCPVNSKCCVLVK